MTMTAEETTSADLELLESIQRRVLWLAVRMVDYANHERPNTDGMKVGGHQASSASMVSIMTALWFDHLRANDYVAVKPHASPVLHAVNYLLGNLDRKYLTELRAFGGLQAYPSRTKDPYPIDYSTGSVGLGAAAPLFGAVVAKYLACHFDAPTDRRFVALLGDAELDEGNVWEAIADPITQGHGNVLWVVDLNRQSLDRVVPGVRADRLQHLFRANDWQVVEAKYGHTLQRLFAEPGGDALRAHLDDMSNQHYQSLFALPVEEVRERFLTGADAAVRAMVSDLDDVALRDAVTNLGGHDLLELRRCFDEAAADPRPSVVFAYTIKGWGLPMAGDRLNHAALLKGEQVTRLREDFGIDAAEEWDRFPSGSREAAWCDVVAARLRRAPASRPTLAAAVPEQTGIPTGKPMSTQEAFGRVVVGLGRAPELAPRMVTTSPDVTVSTNLGGWVNKVGVFSPEAVHSFDQGASVLRWDEGSHGQHLELGISEMNLLVLLGQLGLAGQMFGEPLVPIGTVYDPFVLRGLDAFIHATYSGSRFILVGTPSGVTLSYEGGAHQSIVTPSVGAELPNVTFIEPAYGRALDWLFCDTVAHLHDDDGESAYFRLTTRPIAQAPFDEAAARLGEGELRRQVLAGGYCLRESAVDGPTVHLATSGALVPETLAAAEVLEGEGVRARVLDLTSVDRLFRGWRGEVRHAVATSTRSSGAGHLGTLLPPGTRRAPIVTIQDGAPQSLAWLGSVFGAPVVPLGVEKYGQAGGLADVYAWHQLDPDAIVNAALSALEVDGRD
jgi:pyruvate dehydrogenase E1 component